ncbi:MAG: hypothetical protein WA695_02100 [Candidatus Dormiibacterota bacterium]
MTDRLRARNVLAPVLPLALLFVASCAAPATLPSHDHGYEPPQLTGFARDAHPRLLREAAIPSGNGASVVPDMLPFSVKWYGMLTGPQPSNVLQEVPRTITPTTDPFISVYLRNVSSTAETVSYWVLITHGALPFALGGNPTVPPSLWADVTWSSKAALPPGSTQVTLPPDRVASATVGWPTAAGSPGPGNYYGVVYCYVDGTLWNPPTPFFLYQPLFLQ